jgi:hypothetical protein
MDGGPYGKGYQFRLLFAIGTSRRFRLFKEQKGAAAKRLLIIRKEPSMNTHPEERELASEAKAIVALAFRNGPIEDVHAGKLCPTCSAAPEYSRLTDDERRVIMKSAVNRIYGLRRLKNGDPGRYAREIAFAARYVTNWDDPEEPPSGNIGQCGAATMAKSRSMAMQNQQVTDRKTARTVRIQPSNPVFRAQNGIKTIASLAGHRNPHAVFFGSSTILGLGLSVNASCRMVVSRAWRSGTHRA